MMQSIHVISLLCIIVHSAFSLAEAERVLIDASKSCPHTFDEWVQQRSDVVNTFAFLELKTSDRLGEWARDQLEFLKNCRRYNRALLAQAPGIEECWASVMDWLQALEHFQGGEETLDLIKTDEGISRRLGMNQTDEEYYRRTSHYTEIPKDIAGNQTFLQALSDPKTLQAAYAEIGKMNEARKKQKLPAIEYARFKGNVEAMDSRTVVRLMLYIPGNPEQWFSVGLPSENGIKTPQWSAIAVYKNSAGELHVYFKDHWRVYTQSEKENTPAHVSFEEVKAGKFTDSCWKCHKSGPLKLLVDSSLPEAEQKQTKHFNEIISSYGLVGSGGFYDAHKLGVGLGGDPSEEKGLAEYREKILPYCIAKGTRNKAEWNGIDRSKIQKAMSCTRCHDGVTRGLLTVPLGDVVFRYIRSGAMPPGEKLTEKEREVLAVCLEVEYSGVSSKKEMDRLTGARNSSQWYNGIEGFKKPDDFIPGRLWRHLTQVECTAQGKAEKTVRPAPGHQESGTILPQSRNK